MSITSVAPSTPIRKARSIACMACARSVARVTVNILRHMPGRAGRRAAVALVLLVAACGTSAAPISSTSSPSPSPLAVGSPATGMGWVEDLTLNGDLKGPMTVVAPNVSGQQSECTGKNSRTGGTWASTIYVLLGNQRYGVAFLSIQYRGPASYAEDVASVQVFTPDHSKAWQNLASD